jgi:hypothetical protein
VTALIDEVDTLYEGVVTRPDQWDDQTIADWTEGVGTIAAVDKVSAKHLRRIVRVAEKLRRFWESDTRLTDAAIDWQSRVDIAMGPRAWRPVLELATHLLTEDPTEGLFATVGGLFRVVNNAEWMEGVPYDQWLAGNKRN